MDEWRPVKPWDTPESVSTVLAIAFAVAGTLGLSQVAMLFGEAHFTAVVAAVSIDLPTATWLFLTRHRKRRWPWTFAALLMLLASTITVAVATAPPGRNGAMVAYLWVAPLICTFLPRRQMLFATGWLLGGALAALSWQGFRGGYPVTDPRVLGTWIVLVLAVLMVGALVRWLANRVDLERRRAADRAAAAARLAAVGHLALRETNLQRVRELITRTARELLRCPVVELRLRDGASGVLHCVARAGQVGDDGEATDQARVIVDNGYGECGVLLCRSEPGRRFTVEDLAPLDGLAAIAGAAERRALNEARLRHSALHDALTSLPNRSLFMDRLAHATQRALRDGHDLGVLLIDCDDFKLVNDTLGHAAGDELLTVVARRFAKALRAPDTLARLGGDEFTVIVDSVHSVAEVIHVAERLQAALAAPITLPTPTAAEEMRISASIGVTMAAGRADPDALLRESDAAMYQAKARGRGGIEVYDEPLRVRVGRRLRMENELRAALSADALTVAYQPVVDIADNRVIGFEALARWNHRAMGVIRPQEFIALAEETGDIHALGARVHEQACRQLRQWRRGSPDLWMSVNVSLRQLSRPGAGKALAGTVEGLGLPPGAVRLEVTESVFLDEHGVCLDNLQDARAAGLQLVLDDFGTGYSSFTHLRQLPLAAVKLDRSFIDDPVVTASVVDLARHLELELIIEGVETPRQRNSLIDAGCTMAQGFLWGRPRRAVRWRNLVPVPVPAQRGSGASRCAVISL